MNINLSQKTSLYIGLSDTNGANELELTKTCLYMRINDDLVDLTCLADKEQILKFQLNNGAMDMADNNNVQGGDMVELTICTAQKVNRKCYAKVATSLAHLISSSSISPVSVYIPLSKTSTSETQQFPNIKTSQSDQTPPSTCQFWQKIHIFFGTEEAAKLQNLCLSQNKSSTYPISETDFNEGGPIHEDTTSAEMKDLMPKKIASFLRIDKDIKEGLMKIQSLVKAFGEFDQSKLERKMSKQMDLELDRQSLQFKEHRADIMKRLNEAISKLEGCIVMKDQSVSEREAMLSDISETCQMEKQFKEREALDCLQLESLRQQLFELIVELRNAKILLSQTQIEADHLEQVAQTSDFLGEERHDHVLSCLELALSDLTCTIVQSKQLNMRKKIQTSKMQKITQTQIDNQELAQKITLDQKQDLEQSIEQHKQSSVVLQTELLKLKEESQKILQAKVQQERQLSEFRTKLTQMRQSEEQETTQWKNTVVKMENQLSEQKTQIVTVQKQLQENQLKFDLYQQKTQGLNELVKTEQNLQSMFECADFENRASKLVQEILDSKQISSELEFKLQEIQSDWCEYHGEAVADLKASLDEIDMVSMLRLVEQQAADLQEYDQDALGQIQQEITSIQNEIDQNNNHSDDRGQINLQAAKDQYKRKVMQFKSQLAQKDALYTDLLMQTQSLITMHSQQMRNEQDKLALQSELDLQSVELAQAHQQASTLEQEFNQKKQQYKALKREIEQLDEVAEQLKTKLREREDELDQMEELMMQKQLEIEQREKALGEKAPDFDSDDEVPAIRQPKIIYRAVKGDYCDELLASYINEACLQLPCVRLTEGIYLIGTKKLNAKAQGDHLIVQVGGGYQYLTEFIQQHSKKEIAKIDELKSRGEWDLEKLVATLKHELSMGPLLRNSIKQTSNLKNRLSPRGNMGSPKSTVNGTRVI